MKYCKDCTHYKTGGFCDRTMQIRDDRITGRSISVGRRNAGKERNIFTPIALIIGKCGKWGIYYEKPL